MDYWECTISLPREKVDLVSTFLVTGGYDSFEISDLSDLMESAGAVFADYIEDELLARRDEAPVIRLYFDRAEEDRARGAQSFISGVARQLGWDDIACTLTLVENSDCDVRWKQYFHPFPVGEKLYVKPSWETEVPADARGRGIIEIDPDAAFGTGTHATTYLCLLQLEKDLRPGDRVLDMGCGSGILGIGAKRLGAEEVVSVDIDENAVRIAAENFEKNGCGENARFICGNVLTDRDALMQMGDGFDLICANIVAGIIRDMAPILYAALKPGGRLLASGILASRREEVTDSLTAAGFVPAEEMIKEDWLCLTFTKKGN